MYNPLFFFKTNLISNLLDKMKLFLYAYPVSPFFCPQRAFIMLKNDQKH